MKTNARFALVLLGSNIDANKHLKLALQALLDRFQLPARSPVFQSPPVGAPGTSDYLNQALIVMDPPPHEQFRIELRLIEEELGRKRSRDPNSPRTIDIDILAYATKDLQILDELPIDEGLSTVHHAAIPAAMIASEWSFPSSGKTIGELSRSLGPVPNGFLAVT